MSPREYIVKGTGTNQNFDFLRPPPWVHEDRIRFGPFSGPPLHLLIYEISSFDPPKFLNPIEFFSKF